MCHSGRFRDEFHSIRDGLRRRAIQIDVYFTLLVVIIIIILIIYVSRDVRVLVTAVRVCDVTLLPGRQALLRCFVDEDRGASASVSRLLLDPVSRPSSSVTATDRHSERSPSTFTSFSASPCTLCLFSVTPCSRRRRWRVSRGSPATRCSELPSPISSDFCSD